MSEETKTEVTEPKLPDGFDSVEQLAKAFAEVKNENKVYQEKLGVFGTEAPDAPDEYPVPDIGKKFWEEMEKTPVGKALKQTAHKTKMSKLGYKRFVENLSEELPKIMEQDKAVRSKVFIEEMKEQFGDNHADVLENFNGFLRKNYTEEDAISLRETVGSNPKAIKAFMDSKIPVGVTGESKPGINDKTTIAEFQKAVETMDFPTMVSAFKKAQQAGLNLTPGEMETDTERLIRELQRAS